MATVNPMPAARRLFLIVAVGLLAHLPCVAWGFFADDYGHQLVLAGDGNHATMTAWNLYDFGEAPGPGDWTYERGVYPWWTDTDWKVRFFRPLASLSLRLDHAIFGTWAPGYHLSALVLFGMLLVAAHGLYRALGLGPGVSALATLVLALEDGTTMPVGWTANRNSLVEALLAVLALLVVVRQTRVGWGTTVLALGLAVGAVLSKESGVVVLVLVGIALLWRDRGALAARVGAAFAFAAAAAYPVGLSLAGYGVRCVFYPTPWGGTEEFLARLALLIPGAPASMASPFALDYLTLYPELFPDSVGTAVLLCPGILALSWNVFRRVSSARALMLGACLTLIPQASAPPSDRLYLVPMVGFAGLLAMFIVAGWSGARGTLWRRSAIAAAALALPISGISLFARCMTLAQLGDDMRGVVVEAEVGSPDLGQREVFVLNSPSELAMLMPLPTWIAETSDRNVRFWPLQLGRRELTWKRVDEHSFWISSRSQPLRNGAIERVFLSGSQSTRPMQESMLESLLPPGLPIEGGRWETPLFRVEIGVSSGIGLGHATFTSSIDLDDPRMRFVAWDGERLARILPPAIGETITLPAPEPLSPLLP